MLQDTDREVATFLNRKFGGLIASIETVAKEDLDLVRLTFRVFRFGDSILSLEAGFSIESGTRRLIAAYFGIYSCLLCV